MSVKVINHENVNGVMLSLQIDNRDSPNNVTFKISFKSSKERQKWSKSTLAGAVIFNIIAWSYVHISLFVIATIVITLGFLLFFFLTHSVQSETLTVIPTVGMQITVKYICGEEVCFVPWINIDDIIINEVIQMNRVVYYLTLLVTETQSNKIIPIFKCTRPRLRMLEAIYSEMHSVLKDAGIQEEVSASGDNG